MRLISRRAFCLATAVPVVALAACSNGSSGTPAGPPPEVSSITLDVVPTAEAAGIYIAQEDGYFAQQGLSVKIVSADTTDAGMADLQSGTAQLAEGNYVSFIQAQVAGSFAAPNPENSAQTMPARPISMLMIADASQLQPGNQALYVMPGSSYKTVQQLVKAHAEVGVDARDNVGSVLFGSLLGLNGDKASALKEVPETVSELPDLLAQGSISAAWLPEPFGTIAEQQYGAVRLADFDEGSLQNWPIGTVVGSTTWVKSHPNTVSAFLRAFDQGQRDADTDRQAVETALEKNTPDLTPLIAANMTIGSYPLSIDALVMQRVPDAMYEYGLIKEPFQISSMIQPGQGAADSPG
jgi:NitT/TauT family transport system substrate-binding protein